MNKWLVTKSCGDYSDFRCVEICIVDSKEKANAIVNDLKLLQKFHKEKFTEVANAVNQFKKEFSVIPEPERPHQSSDDPGYGSKLQLTTKQWMKQYLEPYNKLMAVYRDEQLLQYEKAKVFKCELISKLNIPENLKYIDEIAGLNDYSNYVYNEWDFGADEVPYL